MMNFSAGKKRSSEKPHSYIEPGIHYVYGIHYDASSIVYPRINRIIIKNYSIRYLRKVCGQ
jgi:hypothetical protein